MAKTVLLILFLIIIAFFSGRTLMLASGLVSGKKADFFSSFSTGALVIICISFAAHLLTVTGSSLLEDEKRLLGTIMVVFMTVSYFAFVVLTVLTGKKKIDKESKEKAEEKMSADIAAGIDISTDKEKSKDKKDISLPAKVFFVIATVLSIACFVTIVSGSRINSIGDETFETVRCFLDKGEMYTTDPLTGMPYKEGLPGKYKILCLPGMYAVMCAAFGTSPELLIHDIMPDFWFVSGLFAMIALSGALFKGSENELLKRSVFMTAVVLFVYAADLSFYAQGFSVLSQMWTGGAIRVWLLVPVLLFLLIEKRYICALLPVLCEACICRTAYGIGFLACIYAGWVIITLFARRSKCLKAS